MRAKHLLDGDVVASQCLKEALSLVAIGTHTLALAIVCEGRNGGPKPSLVFISQVVSMIRYSSYAVANYRTPAGAEIIYLDPLQVQYEELQKLRQRVREAEAAAAQGAVRRSEREQWRNFPTTTRARARSKKWA